MGTHIIDGTASRAISGGVDDLRDDLTNDYYRTNCVDATTWNAVANGVIAVQRRLSLQPPGNLLASPYAVASTAGYTYVADTAANIIASYNASGDCIGSWGGAGSSPGKFKFIMALAVDNAGNVHVGEWGNRRIQAFDRNGNFLFAYNGSDSPQGSIQGGVATMAYGSFGVTPAIWVYDWSTQNVLALKASDGTYLADSQSSVASGVRCSDPRGMTYHVSSSKLLISDYHNARIILHDTTGARGWTTAACPPSPLGLASDASSNIWIVNGTSTLIKKHTLSGSTLTNTGAYIDVGGSTRLIYGVSCGTAWGTDIIYVADTAASQVHAFSAAGALKRSWSAVDNDPHYLTQPYDLDIDSNNDCLIVDLAGVITKVNSYGNSLLRFGSIGSSPAEFTTPVSVSAGASGDIYVADIGKNCVSRFTSAGDFIGQILHPSMRQPTHVAACIGSATIVTIEGNGTCAATYTLNGGSWVRAALGSSGAGSGQYTSLHACAVGSSDTMYLSDPAGKKVLKYNSAGVYQTMYPVPVTDGYDMDGGMDITSIGQLYVAESKKGGVLHRRNLNNTWTSFATSEVSTGTLCGISADSTAVYLADVSNGRVVVYFLVDGGYRDVTHTGGQIFDPAQCGGSNLVANMDGGNLSLNTGYNINPISALFGNTMWQHITMAATKTVTSDTTFTSLPFTMSFDCPNNWVVWPIDWRASVRTADTTITNKPKVVFSGTTSYSQLNSTTNRYSYQCYLKSAETSGASLPAADSAHPYIIDAFMHVMHK